MTRPVEFPFHVITTRQAGGLAVAECLFFPERSRLGRPTRRLREAILDNARRLVLGGPYGELYRRRRAADPALEAFLVAVEPPERSAAWRKPLRLTFRAAVWAGDAATHVYVPDLAEEFIVPDAAVSDETPLAARVSREIAAALSRRGATKTLALAASLRCVPAKRMAAVNVPLKLPTPWQRRRKAEREDDRHRQPSTLKRVAEDMTTQDAGRAFEVDEVVLRLADALAARRPQGVLLVGPGGVGKTAAVRELVRQRRELGLGETRFFATSGSRLVAGMTGFGEWQQRCEAVRAEAKRLGAVLHVGPLVELMDVGKSEHNRTGVAGFLRPYVARGDLVAVAECTPEQIPLIEAEDPQILEAFHRIDVPEPDAAAGRRILETYAAEPDVPAWPVTPPALDAADRLHRRYATYSAYPGRPIRFLRNLIRDAAGRPDAGHVSADDVLAAFTRETGLPRVLLDPSRRLDLGETRRWFEGRVMGQPDAVRLVVDLLATVKAALTRPGRPIASLLFIGPTGVGKTETAKALAEFLFGSPGRLTRFDMSEFADPVAARRLVGTSFGGRDSEGLLTAKVREQPFSVILFDEFEKADPSCFDFLLQVLGEARLTDAAGRLADFRNAVVILTSNLGAESYQRGGFGFAESDRDKKAAQDHFARAVQRFLRPEMYNRIDRIVPFAPLDEATVRSIADKELGAVRRRDGVAGRPLELTVPPEALTSLAQNGFDARYGARPLKRSLERELLAPLAHRVNQYDGEMPLAVDVGVGDGGLAFDVRPAAAAQAKADPAAAWRELAAAAAALRRWHQKLTRSAAYMAVRNDLYRLGRWQRDLNTGGGRSKHGVADRLARLGRARELTEAVRSATDQAAAAEEAALVALMEDPTADPADVRRRLGRLGDEWERLLLRMYAREFSNPDAVTLAVFSPHKPWLAELASAYAAAFEANGERADIVLYRIPDLPEEQRLRPWAETQPGQTLARSKKQLPDYRWVGDHLEDVYHKKSYVYVTLQRIAAGLPELEEIHDRTVGVGFGVTGPGVKVRYEPEAGRHVAKADWLPGDGPVRPIAVVQTAGEPLSEFTPPEWATRRTPPDDVSTRRTYTFGQLVLDPAVDGTMPLERDGLAAAIGHCVRQMLRASLQQMVLE